MSRAWLRQAAWWSLGCGAVVVGLAAAAGLLRLVPDMSLWGSAVLHGIAVFLCWVAVRADARMEPAERDIVLLAALFLPGFGPALAWTFPRRDRDVRNAHAAFEDDAAVGEFQRSTLTGDDDRDLARELNMMSVGQVLGGESLESKRNLLRSLARVGEQRHLGILRRCLLEGEPEIRLCAYGELEKISRRFEENIAALRVRVRETDRDVDLLAELAEAYQEYATSGVLDPEMAKYWLQQSAKAAGQALDEDPAHQRAALTNAKALAEMRAFVEALEVLDAIEESPENAAPVLLARAEIAISMRDFGEARVLADELRALGQVAPPWLAAVCEPLVGSRS